MSDDIGSVDAVIGGMDEVPSASEQERMVPQSKVSHAIKYERDKAYQRGKEEALAELRAQQGQAPMQSGMSEDDIRRVAREEAMQNLRAQQQQMQMDGMVKSFVGKIDASKEDHPALQQELSQLSDHEFNQLSPVIALANDLPNTADIMAHLMNDPNAMINFVSIAHQTPSQLPKAIHALSERLNQNSNAKKAEQAAEPFERYSGNNRIATDEKNLSVSDFRKMFR